MANYTFRYQVVSVSAVDGGRSQPCDPASITNNLYADGAWNDLSWGAVTGADRYYIYKESGGVFGYIGQSTTTTFRDDNIAPDLSRTPGVYDTMFVGAQNYPGAVAYFEQRRFFAGTLNQPQNVWATASGTESQMRYGLPLRDDDRIAIRVASREANPIRHMVPLGAMVVLTEASEWRMATINSDAITPTTISVRPQAYVGANKVQPIVVGMSMIYAAARGGHVRELGYSEQSRSYATGDLCLRAAHLFDGAKINDLSWCKAPWPIAWAISGGGRLLGLTYVPEQQVGAWHQHTTQGAFESVCTVTEGEVEAVYVSVRRTIGGVTKRFIERFEQRIDNSAADAYFVDCGAVYSGAPTNTISGLDWLNGAVVSILADGVAHPIRTVAGGSITLDGNYSKVAVGLSYTPTIKTAPAATQAEAAFGQGRPKNVTRMFVDVARTWGGWIGPNSSMLSPLMTPGQDRTDIEGEQRIVPIGEWTRDGSFMIQQKEPLPMTIVSLTAEITLGG